MADFHIGISLSSIIFLLFALLIYNNKKLLTYTKVIAIAFCLAFCIGFSFFMGDSDMIRFHFMLEVNNKQTGQTKEI